MKTLEELNREFMNSYRLHPEQSAKDKHIWPIVSAAACFLLVFAVLIGARISGISWYRVSSGSMQRELPEGSLILIKRTDPALIQIGDNITYLRDDGQSITHKVINIIPDNGSGLGFQAQGTENRMADPYIIEGKDVLGVVWMHIPNLGNWLSSPVQEILIVGSILLFLFATLVLYARFSKSSLPRTELRQPI